MRLERRADLGLSFQLPFVLPTQTVTSSTVLWLGPEPTGQEQSTAAWGC
jgi:hypothetical protein